MVYNLFYAILREHITSSLLSHSSSWWTLRGWSAFIFPFLYHTIINVQMIIINATIIAIKELLILELDELELLSELDVLVLELPSELIELVPDEFSS